MTQTKKRMLSACMALMLAFSMLGTVPLAAFAANVKALATYEPKLVYDYVYGVFGGQYALMFKGVTYEGVYMGNPAKLTGYVVDVVRADGSVTLHTAPADLGDSIPGGKAKYASFGSSSYNPSSRFSSGTSHSVEYKRGFTNQRDDLLWVTDKATGKSGIKAFDGTDVVPCNYEANSLFGISGLDGTLCYATSIQGGKGSVKFFGLNGEDQGTISRTIGDKGFLWASTYQPGVVRITFSVEGRDTEVVYARLENGKYKEIPNFNENQSGSAQYTIGGSGDSSNQTAEWDNPNSRYVTTRTFTLANGKKVLQKTFEKRDYMAGDFSITHQVVGADGKPIALGGYTLAVDTDTKQTKTIAGKPAFSEAVFNCVKHGNADIWWAKDKNGKWGAVNSSGEVRVPFKYEGFYDAVGTNTNYALVKEAGKWKFIDLTAELTEHWQRLKGSSELDTMAAIVGEGFDKSDVVVIATSKGFADALSASALAGAYRAPILMTEPNKLSKQTADEIKRLGATKAYICGGKFAVSDAVINQIKSQTSCKTVTRVKGKQADDTSREITKAVGERASSTVIIATQLAYQDALSVSSYSYATCSPIILLDRNGKLSSENVKFLKSAVFYNAVIVGGKYAVPESVVDQLKSTGIKGDRITRLKGRSAYDTSLEIAKWAVSKGLSANAMGVACGLNYPDALAGAALCGKNNAVLLLADSKSSTQAVEFVKTKKTQIKDGYVFGGKYAVPEEVISKLKNALK